MHPLTPLFQELFTTDPLPLHGVELVALQLCYLRSPGEMWEAFREAASAAPAPAQKDLEDWLQNHWNQLSRHVAVPDYEQAVLAALRTQLDEGSLTITGVNTDAGLVFTRSTEHQ
jgi:hypothetical protein